MLKVPQLDDLTYQVLMDRARGMIPTLTDEWTDYNDHDPGITTLQVFAWLCDGLNYYINATGEQHRLKYLKLLGIQSSQQAAHCPIAVNAPAGCTFSLPKGTRLAADDVTFELTEGSEGTANRMTKLYAGEALFDLTAFAGQDGEFATVFPADGKPSTMFLGFAQPLDSQVELFIEIAECGRNSFTDSFSLATLEWSCFGTNGWQRVDVLKDETGGLLKSGTLSLQLPCDMVAYQEEDAIDRAFYLRCDLTDNEYDIPPRIGRVIVNCVQAVQQRTWAEAMELLYDGTGVLKLSRVIYKNAHLSVAFWDGEQYVNCDDLCEIAFGDKECFREIHFNVDQFGWEPEKDTKLLVMMTEQEAVGLLTLGVTDGCSEQMMEFDTDNLLELRLALIGQNPQGRSTYTLWESIEDLSQAGYDDLVFSFDAQRKMVCFGNGICGQQPQQGLMVTAVTVRTSLLQGGNVRKGQINRLVYPENSEISVVNLKDATDGKRRSDSKELESEIEKKLRKVTRAVTEEDYQTLVRETPGLLIDGVAVIPVKRYGSSPEMPMTPNTVVVAVKPGSVQQLPVLGNRYQQRIRDYLEEARLLTTDIRVVSARYVGVSIYGRIALTENNPINRNKVEAEIHRQVNTVSRGAFGQGVDYGRMFSALEMLDCVSTVTQLSMEYIGAGGKKNEHGDIEAHADSLCYCKEIGIEYL